MSQLFFKKQTLGRWRRDDGEFKVHVNEEAMFREIQKLINDGWDVETYGLTSVRAISVTSPNHKSQPEHAL